MEIKINISRKIFSDLDIGKNSMTRRNIRQENAAKIPSAFHDPKTFPVLPPNIPRERIAGRNKRNPWKTRTSADDNIVPKRTVFASLGVRRIIEHISISKKAEKMNQKLPISNNVPNKDTWGFVDTSAEIKKANVMPKPERMRGDFGITTLPSKNLAIAQNIIEVASPKTSKRPLEVSIGILVKGK